MGRCPAEELTEKSPAGMLPSRVPAEAVVECPVWQIAMGAK